MPIAISNYLRKRIWARLEKCVSSIRPTKDTTGAFERKRKREARGAFSEGRGKSEISSRQWYPVKSSQSEISSRQWYPVTFLRAGSCLLFYSYIRS